MKIYTRKGDDGTTGLLYGGRIDKDDLRTEAYGTTDEAVALIGLARSAPPKYFGLSESLLQIQRDLFVVGAELATLPENSSKLEPGVSKVTEEMVTRLEEEIDTITKTVPLPDYFVVPGETWVSATLDVARAVVRRAERRAVALSKSAHVEHVFVIRYLNRLSDFLFVAARAEESVSGVSAPPSR